MNTLKELFYEVQRLNVKAGPPVGSAQELAYSFLMFVLDESNAQDGKLDVPNVLTRLGSQKSFSLFVCWVDAYENRKQARALWPEVCRLTAPYVERIRKVEN